MLRRDLAIALRVSGAPMILQALAPVALDQPLDEQEQVGPDRLRAGEAAPQPARQRVREDQDGRGEDQQPRDQIEVLRPDLDEERVEPSVGEIEQDRLVRRVRAAVPAQERRDVVDRERQQQDHPLDAADRTLDGLRDDRLAGAAAAAFARVFAWLISMVSAIRRRGL